MPYAARPILALARGNVGSWDATAFSLLVVNALFTATAAWLLVLIGARLSRDPGVPFLGACLLLLSFGIPHFALAGLVESALLCAFTGTAWALVSGRPWCLPAWAIVGALTKESALPLSIAFLCGWWLAMSGRGGSRWALTLWAVAAIGAGWVTEAYLMRTFANQTLGSYLAASVGAAPKGLPAVLAAAGSRLASHDVLYIFAWLLPLGLSRVRHLPREWRFAVMTTCAAALVLTTLRGPGGDFGRACFNVAGPLLSLASAQAVAALFASNSNPPVQESGG